LASEIVASTAYLEEAVFIEPSSIEH
jgi:hypothetical protein